MIFDRENCFNTVTASGMTAQSETTAAQYDSTNVIDTTKIPRTVIQSPLFLIFQVVAALVSAAGGTILIELVCSAATALSTPTVLWSSSVVSNAVMVAWSANSLPFQVPVPPRIPLRYLGMSYTIADFDLTAGSWNAWLTAHPTLGTPATP